MTLLYLLFFECSNVVINTADDYKLQEASIRIFEGDFV